MKHDYGNYSIAAPVIKDHLGAIEDAAGSMRVSETLVSSLLGDIDGMQGIARRQKERPGSVSAEAVNDRLDALWALTHSISERLKNDIILLEAVIDQQPANQLKAA
jgi:hypothetical protein